MIEIGKRRFILTISCLSIAVLLVLPAFISFRISSAQTSPTFTYTSTEGAAVNTFAGGDPCTSGSQSFSTSPTDGISSVGFPNPITSTNYVTTTYPGSHNYCNSIGSVETSASGSASALAMSTCSPGCGNGTELTDAVAYNNCPDGTCPESWAVSSFYNEVGVDCTLTTCTPPTEGTQPAGTIQFVYDMTGVVSDTSCNSYCGTGATLTVTLAAVNGITVHEATAGFFSGPVPCVELASNRCSPTFIYNSDCLEGGGPCSTSSFYNTGTQTFDLSEVCQTATDVNNLFYGSHTNCPNLDEGDTFVISASLTVGACTMGTSATIPCDGASTASLPIFPEALNFSDPMSIEPLTPGIYLDDFATSNHLCMPSESCGTVVTPVFPIGTILAISVPLAALSLYGLSRRKALRLP